MSDRTGRLSPAARALLALRIVRTWVGVRARVHREPLPRFVERLGSTAAPAAGRHHPPRRLSVAVHRVLRLGGRRPSCLVKALVLYILLREQGDSAQVVIGLPAKPTDKDAHAWVELEGEDIGPHPGRMGHAEMARFG